MNEISNGPRIALVGSCQVVGMQAALVKLCPDAVIKAWHIGTSADTKEQIASQLDQFDLIVTQIREVDKNAPLALERLQAAHGNVTYVPTLVFNGFHPDCVYMRINGQLFVGPMSHLQSGIIAASFSWGLPEDKVARLFNSLTYSALGYFEAFEVAHDLTLRSFASAGFDLRPYFEDWQKSIGSFMHTLNHPRICVLTALAHMVAVRAELIEDDAALPDDVNDFLSDGILWPVYPEIARRLKISGGSTVFRRARQEHDLNTIISAFYRSYEGIDRHSIRDALPNRIVEGFESVLNM